MNCIDGQVVQLERRIYAKVKLAFSPDGKRIVSGSWDNTLRLWPVLEAWAYALCAKLPRNMSHAEWRQWVSPEIAYVKQCPNLPDPAD